MRHAFASEINSARDGKFVLIATDTHERRRSIANSLAEALKQKPVNFNFRFPGGGSIRLAVANDTAFRGFIPDVVRQEFWISDVTPDVWESFVIMRDRAARKANA